jgi:hypothetical protein
LRMVPIYLRPIQPRADPLFQANRHIQTNPHDQMKSADNPQSQLE